MSDIPQSIITALTKYQDRPFILYLEKDLIKFIKNSILGNIKQPEYVIQAQYLKNSYYRLLSHQLCQYYHLQHWNNQSNEIVVTPSENFDYSSFLIRVEDESSDFVKVADVAHKYQPVHTPEPPYLNGYTQPQPHHNVNHHQHLHNIYHPHQHQHQHQHQHHSHLDRIDSIRVTGTPFTSNPQSFKPKMIVKKIIPKPTTSSPPSEASDNNNNDSIESLSKLKIDENASSSAPPSEGSDVSLNTTSSTTIESQRASKEALYKKVREEIFLKEDEDQTGEEEETVEGEEGEEEEKKQLEEIVDKGFTKERPTRTNYRRSREYTPGYSKNHYSVPYQVPIQMQYPQMYHPHHNGASPAIPQGSTLPVLYSPYYPTVQPPLVPQAYAPPFHTVPSYDKETERRILNNPYIILPSDIDSHDRFKNPKHQQLHKSKKMYQNGNGSGASIGRNSNYKGQKPT